MSRPAELHRSFTRQPIGHRIAVLLAGPAMNLMFAVVLYAVLAMVGTEIVKPVVGAGASRQSGRRRRIARGDEIVRVGDHGCRGHRGAADRLASAGMGGAVVPLRVQRADGEIALTLHLVGDRRPLTEPASSCRGSASIWRPGGADTVVQSAPAGSAGARAGLGPATGCFPSTAGRS